MLALGGSIKPWRYVRTRFISIFSAGPFYETAIRNTRRLATRSHFFPRLIEPVLLRGGPSNSLRTSPYLRSRRSIYLYSSVNPCTVQQPVKLADAVGALCNNLQRFPFSRHATFYELVSRKFPCEASSSDPPALPPRLLEGAPFTRKKYTWPTWNCARPHGAIKVETAGVTRLPQRETETRGWIS